jgi:hypothetical protein
MQEAALELYTQFNCCVVFLGADLKERYYKGARLAWHIRPSCTPILAEAPVPHMAAHLRRKETPSPLHAFALPPSLLVCRACGSPLQLICS